MSGRLFIKGIKEPIFLSDAEVTKAQIVQKDTSVPDSSVISIGGKWIGEKGSIRYVVADEVPQKEQEATFTDAELEKFFQEELKSFVVKKWDEQYRKFISVMKQQTLVGQFGLYTKKVKELELDKCSEDELDDKLERLADEVIVGKFTFFSELLFLEYKQCVVVDWSSSNWSYSVVMHRTGDIPFRFVNSKLKAWKEYNYRKEREESVFEVNSPPNLTDNSRDIAGLTVDKQVVHDK